MGKVCTKCHEEKSLDNFPRDKAKKDGFYPSCKECYRKRIGSKPRHRYFLIKSEDGFTKECSICKVYKPISEFYTRPPKQHQPRYDYPCKLCVGERGKTLKYREKTRERQREIRREVLEHYGSICTCCGEREQKFLCIDHIGGWGNKHRKEVKTKIYAWLIKNNYPEGLQVLCHNCNMAKGFYGICPHKIIKHEENSRKIKEGHLRRRILQNVLSEE